ncbi:MAG TPA: family 20 glycosylhydrolase [Chitinophagaceae bacterium]|nr:family 20 glycosylhydrolase [Chitinophagaceae bacterium]
MKQFIYTLAVALSLLVSTGSWSQVNPPLYPDSLFSTYYHQRVSLFRKLPQTKDDIIFLGNSITDGGEWSELFADLKIKNRGISGDITAGVLNRLDEVYSRQPAKVFLLIGTNDLARNLTPDSVTKNIFRIATLLHEKSPFTKLYVQSVFPVNEQFGKFSGHTSKKQQIIETNQLLRRHAAQYNYQYTDVNSALSDSTGRLSAAYTNDGLHLTGPGYVKWKETIFTCVYDLPALIPRPTILQWNHEKVDLTSFKFIAAENPLLKQEALFLQSLFIKHKTAIRIISTPPLSGHFIRLMITPDINNKEGYRMSVKADGIRIAAKTATGIFYAIQTLQQLITGKQVQCAEISDAPAFPYRGFMVDVGRNFQTTKQLKQQIEVMAAYKLNVFHFHLTEDIAWRLQSKQFPQLTDAKHMLRNAGKYYSIPEMKELIAYCRQRHITLIPEIDMPGHSAAFKRAMGVDMQTEKGMKICKNILRELCLELDVPIVHIGGDEVKIVNKDFLPQMTALLQSLGKKVITWDPGGSVPEGTWLQMWIGTAKPKDRFPSIDSRHLYLNHFDPLDGVAATFNHMICDVPVSDETKTGATLCNWPDRRVAKEEDLITMNAVYPVMLTFAERCWQGGGWKNYLSDISIPGTERYIAFEEFENRLLEHKSLYFKNMSFPYVRQTNIEWHLLGPFDNKGNTEMAFAPESTAFADTVQLTRYPSVYGGSIWLRHFWHPMIQSHLENPEDSATYYAIRKIWSDKEGIKKLWIGFNDLSRSTATDSPPANAWDEKGSALWVNGKKIPAPEWKRAGQKGDQEIPLTDEGFAYREPVMINFHKGWNIVLVKAPVASFIGKDWQNPVKWIFTVAVAAE